MAAIGSRDEIETFRQGAVDGVFTIDRDTAQRCADHVSDLIELLQDLARRTRRSSGWLRSTLESEQQMYTGFENKLHQVGDYLDEYTVAAERLRESFLIAGKILSEQDDSFAGDIAGVGEPHDGGGR